MTKGYPMKAWVITVTSLDAAKKQGVRSVKVLALISARKREDFIKTYIENMFQTLGLDLEGQKAAAKYNKPDMPPKVISQSGFDIYCFKHPFIIRGQRSIILNIRNENGVNWLRWQGEKYNIYDVNSTTYEPMVVQEEIPPIMEAPQAEFQLWNLFG
jgi:hypothetical protein